MSNAPGIWLLYVIAMDPAKPLRLVRVVFVYLACPCGIIRAAGFATIEKSPATFAVTVGRIVAVWYAEPRAADTPTVYCLVGALLAADIVMSNCEVPPAGNGTDVVVGLMLRFIGSDE
jgi:hypothetical protein